MLKLKKAVGIVVVLCISLTFTMEAVAYEIESVGKKQKVIELIITMEDEYDNLIPNLSVSVVPNEPGISVTASDPAAPNKTNANGKIYFYVNPGAYTVTVSDPKQDWILEGKAPVREYDIQVGEAVVTQWEYHTLTWDQTTPDEFSATIRDKVVFHLVEPDGSPAKNRKVYLDYQKNKNTRGYGKVAGGYSDKDGVYTYLKPLDRKITLFVLGDDITRHELTLPALSALPDVGFIKVEVPALIVKTNPATAG